MITFYFIIEPKASWFHNIWCCRHAPKSTLCHFLYYVGMHWYNQSISVQNFGCPCAWDKKKKSPDNQKYWSSCPWTTIYLLPKLTFVLWVYSYSKYGQPKTLDRQPKIVTWLSMGQLLIFLNSNTDWRSMWYTESSLSFFSKIF